MNEMDQILGYGGVPKSIDDETNHTLDPWILSGEKKNAVI